MTAPEQVRPADLTPGQAVRVRPSRGKGARRTVVLTLTDVVAYPCGGAFLVGRVHASPTGNYAGGYLGISGRDVEVGEVLEVLPASAAILSPSERARLEG